MIPGLLQGRQADQPLRIWVAGDSTGEEVYSLIILFHEAAAAAVLDGKNGDLKLQVFASDIDAAAVVTAREGLYPLGITADVSASRLAKFFTKEDGHGYRVLPDLRASVVFAVQDLLTDPPFSRIDLLSCRNLMIYLGPEAQAKAINLFHFALKTGGVLLLGTAETLGETDDRFELIQKAARLYRHVGRRLPGDLSFAAPTNDTPRGGRLGRLADPRPILSRQMVLAEAVPAGGAGSARSRGSAMQCAARVPVFTWSDRSLPASGARACHDGCAGNGARRAANPPPLRTDPGRAAGFPGHPARRASDVGRTLDALHHRREAPVQRRGEAPADLLHRRARLKTARASCRLVPRRLAYCRAGAGTGGGPRRTGGGRTQPGSLWRGAARDRRGSAVRQRGIPVHQ